MNGVIFISLPDEQGEEITLAYNDIIPRGLDVVSGDLLIKPDRYMDYLIICKAKRKPDFLVKKVFTKGRILKKKYITIQKL